MQFAQRFIASLAVLFAICCPFAADAAVGRTVGSATVTQTGSASYSIPVVVPPGTNGMTPSLTLSYNSRSDNGVLGVGWSISGLSTIVRCPRTWTQDSEARDVRNDSSDRFCLNGNKLRWTSGTYGANGATYRTEIETFARITSYGSNGNGPAYFIVETKDGLIYEYGNDPNGYSRIESVGQPTARAWAVSKVRDRSDNAITFDYAEDTTNGSFRITSIAYTSNATQGVAATHSVGFTYETKPSSEIDSGYIAGSVVKEITRLDHIDVLYGATTVRRYQLTYEGALSSTSKSRLSSVQECAGSSLDCFPATTFSYQNGTSGLNANINTGVSIPTTPWALDVNADGRTDLVYSSSATSGSGVWMVMLANTSGGYNSPIATGVTNTNYAGAIPIDYNADGAEDLLVPYSGGTWWAMLGSASGLAAPVNTGAPSTATGTGNNARAMDINGDGLEDLVWADIVGWAGGDAIRYRLREWGGTFSSTVTNLIGPMAADTIITTNVFSLDSRASRRRTQDFNGDGRADLIYRVSRRVWDDEQQRYITTPRVSVHCVGAWNINAEDLSGSVPLYFGDFNGDGKTDVLYRTISPFVNSVRLSTGKTLKAGFNVSIPSTVIVRAILDWDGDGYDDALGRSSTDGTWYVLRSTGESFTAAVATGLSAGTDAYTVMDVNGDGLPDLGNTVSGAWDYRLHSGVTSDLLQTATDGFGNYTTFNYSPLLSASYTKYTDATYPARDYQGSLPVVTAATSSNGIGGSYTVSYAYYGARVNLQGRGFEGFYARRSQDSRDSIYIYEYFNRAFPYTGTPFQLDTYQPNHTTLMSRVENTWSSHAYESGVESAVLPYVSASTIRRYEAGGTYDGVLVSTTSTTNSVHAATGTLYDTTSTTTEANSGNGVQPGATYTQRVYSPIAYFTTDASNWCLGRPGHTEYTNSHSQFGGGAITRTIDRTWDSVNCRVTQHVEEPSSTEWKLTTDIGYDDYGNVSSQTVTGIGMPARATMVSYAASSGRSPMSVTNALSQTAQLSWNPTTGTLASVTDPNGIATSWQYDVFDRRTWEYRADGTRTNWQYADCTTYGCLAGGNNKMIVVATQYDTGGVFVTDQKIYTDKMDRPIATSARMLSGAYNRIDQEYDALGRVYRESAACWASGCTQYWTTYSYDLFNRVTQAQRPVSDSDPTLQSTATYYESLTTRTVDALSKQLTHVGNAIGQLARSTDHNGYYQDFDYDSFGNLVRVTDSGSNVLMSNVYNVRGMRTSQTDMDMGTWTYTPNALGEVVSQTDANNQTTTYEYDRLSRMTKRTELEGESNFAFGTSAAAHNIGRLASISGDGYLESLTYDGVGRTSQRTINMLEDGLTHQIAYAYNSIGALATLTYPTSTSGYRLKLQYEYQNGLLQRVRDFNAPAAVFWTVNDTDPQGAVISETLGNGVQTVRGFDAVTGLLDYIESGLGGGSILQNASYQWDRVGNLTQRSEANIGKTQDFQYDNLHRLDYWTANGASPVDLEYDALGNITSRSDVGTYTYHATRKHLATQAGVYTFDYDNNGNATTRNGSLIDWYSFNLPMGIRTSGSTSAFFHAPDRSRLFQAALYEGILVTTKYIGDLVEVVELGEVTSWKHYIPGANGSVAEYIRRSDGTNETVYLLKDHLGSTEVVTDAIGGELARLAYDAFGKRRNGSTWDGIPSSGEWATIANTTRRGFTGHEMLDNLNLVHMNGRVYDPAIGRFLSADPIVQAPAFTQSFNRYSYVLNNPLRYTDPSGFSYDPVEKCEHACPGSYGAGGFLSGSSITRVSVYQPQAVTQNNPNRTGPTIHQPWPFPQLGSAGARNVGDGYVTGDSGSTGGGSLSGSTVGGVCNGGTGGPCHPTPSPLPPELQTAYRVTGAIADYLTRDPTLTLPDGREVPAAGGTVFTPGIGSARATLVQVFRSHTSMVRALGPAGAGRQWHHVVEQTPGNVSNFGAYAIHNTQNAIALDVGVHRQISGFYSSIAPQFTGSSTLTVRQWLSTQSLNDQRLFGEQVLHLFGVP